MTDKEKRTITEQSAADESMRAVDVNGCDGADEPCDAAQEPNDEMKPSGNPEARRTEKAESSSCFAATTGLSFRRRKKFSPWRRKIRMTAAR